MSIIVSGISLPIFEDVNIAYRNAARICGVSLNEVVAREFKCSADARGHMPKFVRSIELDGIENEADIVKKIDRPNVKLHSHIDLESLVSNLPPSSARPIVVGFGPSGMFAALTLALRGMAPIVLERGECLEERDGSVDIFYRQRRLNIDSNIQFGEGGAGAYSDGKLTTRINDPYCEAVLDAFVKNGAPSDILRNAKPHIGTDVLKPVVVNIRKQIERLGGRVLFKTRVDGLLLRAGRVIGVMTNNGDFESDAVILAIGHSARDTAQILLDLGVEIHPKPFSMGVRIEHLQEDLDRSMYGKYAGNPLLPSAEYQLSYRNGERACYSFCMCPGGSVVAAASEYGRVVTNGMSRHARDGRNANAALAVPVSVESFPGGVLGGIDLARGVEAAAFLAGGSDYTAPAQLVRDLLEGKPSRCGGRIKPTFPMGVRWGSLEGVLPDGFTDSLREGLLSFAKSIRCFGDGDAVMTAPETRTSSPIRIPRNTDFSSLTYSGLYPCGDGAGYAGGIMSAAVDGIRIAMSL